MQMKQAKVNVVKATAKVAGKNPDGTFNVIANGETYVGKKLLIASGSNAAVPPIPGLKEALAANIAMTNREILDMTEDIKSLIVMGGGVIGLEMASYFNSIGVKVTVVEMMDRIGGPTDLDMTKILKAEYEKRGVVFMLSTKVTELKGNKVMIENANGKSELTADKILVSIGRRANSADLGYETIGLFMERGAVKTDDEMKTNVPNVWAAGDINGKSMLAHTAYREAEVAVNVMLGKKDKMTYDAIPAVIYTTPEVGTVGMSEEQAKAAGFDAKTVKLKMMFSGRYVAENEGGDGIIKLVYDQNTNRVLGVHMIGSYASEIIMTAVLIVDKQMRIADVKKSVFPHPTVAEIIREAIFEIK
jgi:dihydrolipoamide dehydrogenase